MREKNYDDWLMKNEYEGKTVQNYVSSIRNIMRKTSKTSEIQDNLFICDKSKIDEYISLIESSDNYNEINSSSHRTYSSALKSFKEFLNPRYYSLKISDPSSIDVVSRIKNKENEIEIDRINQHRNELRAGDIIFVSCYGDSVSWIKGLYGIALVSKRPYDIEKRNFKFQIDMLISFPRPISRDEFIPFADSYNAADIGPSTKGSQNQALKRLENKNAFGVIRGIIELFPEVKDKIIEKLNWNDEKSVLGAQKMLISTDQSYSNKFSKNKDSGGYNKIVYGIPGTGKSYYVKNTILGHVQDSRIIRTTFHPEYTNSDFIGQIVPDIFKGNVRYRFIPGAFTRALEAAYASEEMIYLVIEEINRGNTAQIFGEVIQLLDRELFTNELVTKGTSQYPISIPYIESYFDERSISYEPHRIVIPGNLTILATMNLNDQNVFALDNAFKRRWKMERIVTDWNACSFSHWHIPIDLNITWEQFVKSINSHILSERSMVQNEDKQIGCYFIDNNYLVNPEESLIEDGDERINDFIYKIFEYLWNDVIKYDKEHWITSSSDFSISSFDEFIESIRTRKLSDILKTDFKRYERS